MKKLFLLFLFFALPLFSIEHWAIYYADKLPASKFFPFQLVIFDNQNHPFLQPLEEKEIVTLGYLSLGEVEQQRPYFEQIKKAGILLGENPNWKGSFYVDLREKIWIKKVIEELVPSILFQRFNGIFIDTLDNAEFLEAQDPQKYKGMKQAAINLVKAIRLHYPKIKIMLNRAYFMYPKVACSVDMQLGESIYSRYNFKTKTYEIVPEQEYQDQVKLLKEIKTLKPSIEIFTLDYWDPNDVEGYKKIYSIQRENGFIPYVATLELNTLIPEPK